MQGRCRVDVVDVVVDGKYIYNRMRRGGKIIELRENNKIVEEGIKNWGGKRSEKR